MDNIRNSQIISVIDALTRVVEIDKIKIEERIQEYQNMSDKDVIKDLSMFVYDNFKNDKELCEYFLSLIRNINPKVVPSVKDMMIELERRYQNKNDNMSIEENHKLIIEMLKYLAGLFNDRGIDYCVVGSIPAFLENNIPLFRYHDDLDIMINENDLDKVKGLITESGYIYSDYRFPSIEEYRALEENKPSHQVMAQNPYNEFHIGFLTFIRNEDNSITTTEYLQRENNNEVVVDRLERRFTQEGTDIRFNRIFNLDGVNVRACSAENVYDIKSQLNRPKDKTDMEKLESYIDKSKLKELRRNTNTKNIVKNISLENGMKL